MAVSHVKSNTIADWAAGAVTVANSTGGTQTVDATNLVRPSDWNSAHNQFVTISGNTAGTVNGSGTNIVFGGSNDITLNLSTAGGGGQTLWIQNAVEAAYWACPPYQGNSNGLISNITKTEFSRGRPMFFPFYADGLLSANEFYIVMSRATSGQNNSFTVNAGIYSHANWSSINLISSTQVAFANTDNAASITGVKKFEIPMPVTTLSQGQYYLGLGFSANGDGTSGMNYSMMGAQSQSTNQPVGSFIRTGSNAFNATVNHGPFAFWGRYTATSAGMPAAVSTADMTRPQGSEMAMYFTIGRDA